MIRLFPLLTAAAVAAVTLAAQGCAGPQWTKPGADASVISRDVDDCRGLALRRSAPAVAPSASSQATTDRGRSSAPLSLSAGTNERFIDEQEEVNRCMLDRGYRLQRQG